MHTYLKISVGVVVVAAVIGGGWYFMKQESPVLPASVITDYKYATYIIDGQPVTLKNGVFEAEAAPGSASKISTRYFGNEVRHDFDGDGREDVAFILTRETGGSGLFYYFVGARNTTEGYVGSDAVFLGDRIAPQSTSMGRGNIVVVNYAERAFSESFAVAPHIGKSRWLLLDTATMKWGEVTQNFEGETDPSRMTLGMKTWNWLRTDYNNDSTVTPRNPKKFTLTFREDKTFSASTDCNGIGGTYVVNGGKIVFQKMMSTLMFCQDSQEQEFGMEIENVSSYHFDSKGQLILEIKFDSGVMIFN